MRILVAGDFCPQYSVAELFDKGEFDTVLGEVKPIIEHADYSIVNFECPVCIGEEKPIEKCGPNLKCSERGLEAVKWAGFDCVTLANNHFLDYGEKGVINTLSSCKKYELDMVGGGQNLSEASQILYKEFDGIKLAIINCCEHEFSIATENAAGSNPLNPIQQYYAIKEARKNADYVLVIVHGGHEYYQLPSPRMQETYRFFVDAGADAVVNHHQHCFSGYEVYNSRPIFYGLGNFCFEKQNIINTSWNKGYLLIIDFLDTIKFKIIPYQQCNGRSKLEPLDISSIQEDISTLNEIIKNKNRLEQKMKELARKNQKFNYRGFYPFTSRIIYALFSRGLWPSFLSKERKTTLLSILNCESHNDILITNLKNDLSV